MKLKFVLLALLSFAAASQSYAQSVCCLLGSSSLSGLGRPITGNLNTTWEKGLLEDHAALIKLFKVRPHMFYLEEEGGPNAFSTNQVFPDLLAAEGVTEKDSPDGTIFLGLKLIQMEARNTKGSLFSLPAILAHEFAHSVQFKTGCLLQGKKRELHADYIAGYFIAHRARFRKQSTAQAAKNFFAKGDYMFNDAQHHGTPEERWNAFWAGYQLNKASKAPSGVYAYNQGLLYLRRLK
jgi:hypothetical protein